MEERINVCLLNDSFPPLIDGVANTVMNYAAIVNEKYGKATVAVPYYPGTDDSGYPYKIVRYPSINTERLVNYRAGYPFSPETLEKIKEENIDIIHTHCPFASAFLARTLRKPLDAPVVFTYHTKFDVDISRALKNDFLKKRVLRHLVKNIESCDDVWVVSEGAGENLRSIGYNGEYIVMPNGVDIPKGRVPEEKIKEVCKDFDLPEDVPVFLFVGRMAWYKGLDLIIEALSMILESKKDFRMVFVGGGMDKNEVEKYAEEMGISEKCVFTGPIHERESIRAWYCRADLFVFPSVYDTNGLVVREAAACGLASVLIKNSCAAEGVTDGETGFLCENSAKALAEKLSEIMEKPEEMRKTGNNAMEKIYVSWEDSVKNAVERYKIIIEKYRRGECKKNESFTEDWLRTEGEILDAVNRAKKHGRNAKNEVKFYGYEMLQVSARAAKSFKNRGVKLKNKTKNSGIRMKNVIKEKIERYL